MFIPPAFVESDRETLYRFMEQNSFALLVSQVEAVPFATHLPILVDRQAGGKGTLCGHVARANPHWEHWLGEKVLVVFSGAHAYISPSWYQAANMVPTWNYQAVHVIGKVSVVEDPSALLDILQRSAAIYEQGMPKPWSFDPEATFIQKMLPLIVGFQVEIESIEGKFKLGQNHSLTKRESVATALAMQGDENSLGIAKAMRATIGEPGK